ncbi:two-component sensor histidine kinase [Dictyobacter alpinus]|uniref:histidine kinase n=1 Tax=Dictyobacter alpinus TaxID=2014873 RepID=A0A402BGV7_9CHLR|nr:two-component sensor histidine kinase [Dictyobacter alpinus]
MKRLRWAVTHSHLMVVVIGSGVISAAFVFLQLLLGVGKLFTDATPLYATIVFLFAMFLLTIFVVACVLPPSILSSYIFTRRITRRIEHLAQATSMLRSGNYSIRVHVEGEDEIAHLQADFNAMASELERTMHALKEERDNVEMLLNARRELIASVSHELRTPVATVRSYLESALANWHSDQPPATLKQDMHIIEQQTIRLQSLINDLFVLARAEVGRLEMRCEPTNVEMLVKRVVETIAPVAWRGSRVEVLAETALIAPEFPQALVDRNRLEQILHNLIHNGTRHTAPGGIVAVVVNANERQVIFQVKDTGEGIAAEELDKIWDRFYRASNAQKGSGTGLGLAIVKEFTVAMGGSVSVESVVGEGSCFTLCFPRAQEPHTVAASFGLDPASIKTMPLSLS